MKQLNAWQVRSFPHREPSFRATITLDVRIGTDLSPRQGCELVRKTGRIILLLNPHEHFAGIDLLAVNLLSPNSTSRIRRRVLARTSTWLIKLVYGHKPVPELQRQILLDKQHLFLYYER